MKYIVIEKRLDKNDTLIFEYDTIEAAIENIKHMRTKELQPHLGVREIRLVKAEEIDISDVEGYSLIELNKKNTEGR